MPSISRKNVASGTANALNGLRFEVIKAPGALVSLYASTPTAGGTITFGVGAENFCQLAELNIESSADRVDLSNDGILLREPFPPGKMFLSVDTQIGNFVVVIEDLPG